MTLSSEELLAIGHDRDDVAAFRRDLPMRLGERVDVDAAIGTPMTAVERHCHGARSQQLIEADHVPVFVRKIKGWHRVARVRRAFAGAVLPQPPHHPVDGGREFRASAARRLRKGQQLPAERGVHAANALERFFEAFPW